MAKLAGPHPRQLEIVPLRYQGNAASGDHYEANWLRVRIALEDEARRVSGESATVLTWEMRELVMWALALARDDPRAPGAFATLEGSLGFSAERAGGEVRLVARIAAFLLPPEARSAGEVQVALVPGEAGLRAFAAQLERELRPFPVR